jgi:hypothetical protein
MILTADWHLTEQARDEYRWRVFETLRGIAQKEPGSDVFILGDICDKKDRHSAALVNRLVNSLQALASAIKPRCIHILMGNHDQALKGAPFWSFLRHQAGLAFYDVPAAMPGGLVLLPFHADPASGWAACELERKRAAFAHQPLDGARLQNGRKLDMPNGYRFPPNLQVYAGDIHVPQRLGNVTYIGAPHPIDFGDDYLRRMLVLHPDFSVKNEVMIQGGASKHLLEIEAADDLARCGAIPGDQAKVRCRLALNKIEQWPAERDAITEWAKKRQVLLAAIEVEVLSAPTAQAGTAAVERSYADPASVLEAYGQAEKMQEPILRAGAAFLTETLDALSAGKA